MVHMIYIVYSTNYNDLTAEISGFTPRRRGLRAAAGEVHHGGWTELVDQLLMRSCGQPYPSKPYKYNKNITQINNSN